MKKLYLIRHAKSSWKNLNLTDFHRPLNKRGMKDAPNMGKLLNNLKIKADLIISSPALRAKQTAQIIANEIDYCKNDITYYKLLYDFKINYLSKTIKHLDNKYEKVFLIGHNPNLNLFSQKLLNFKENIPTCAILEIEFMCQAWEQIDSKNSHLLSFWYPKKLSERKI